MNPIRIFCTSLISWNNLKTNIESRKTMQYALPSTLTVKHMFSLAQQNAPYLYCISMSKRKNSMPQKPCFQPITETGIKQTHNVMTDS